MPDTARQERLEQAARSAWRKQWPFACNVGNGFREFTDNGRILPGWLHVAILHEWRSMA